MTAGAGLCDNGESPGPMADPAQPSNEATDGNVVVIARLRPSMPSVSNGHSSASVPASVPTCTVEVEPGRPGFCSSSGTPNRVELDEVLDPDAPQTALEPLAGELAQDVLSGFSTALIACGPRGAGKSYSLFGPAVSLSSSPDAEALRGVLPRAACRIFAQLGRLQEDVSNMEWQVSISYFELRGERVRDLLCPRTRSCSIKDGLPLELHQHPLVGTFVPGLTEDVVDSPAALLGRLALGHRARAEAESAFKGQAHRGHIVVDIRVVQNRRGVATGTGAGEDVESESVDAKRRSINNVGWSKLQALMRERRSNSCAESVTSAECTPTGSTIGACFRRQMSMNATSLEGRLLVVELAAATDAQRSNGWLREAPPCNSGLPALAASVARLSGLDPRWRGAALQPLRTGQLMRLLSSTLAGHCRTRLLVALTPAEEHRDEVEELLGVASAARSVRTLANCNLSSADRAERLELEVARLREQSARGTAVPGSAAPARLAASQCLLADAGRSLQERRADTQARERVHHTLQAPMLSALERPALVHQSADPLLAGALVHEVTNRGQSIVAGSEPSCDIWVTGPGTAPRLCSISWPEVEATDTDGASPEFLDLKLEPALSTSKSAYQPSRRGRVGADGAAGGRGVVAGLVLVNGAPPLGLRSTLRDGDVVQLGRGHTYTVRLPGLHRISLIEDTSSAPQSSLKVRTRNPDEGPSATGLSAVLGDAEGSLATAFYALLADKLGIEGVESLTTRWQAMATAADEAQEILDEIYGLMLAAGSHGASHDPPQVSLALTFQPSAPLGVDIVARFSDKKSSAAGASKASADTWWDEDTLRRRLSLLREAHHELVVEGGSIDACLQAAPWREFDPAERSQLQKNIHEVQVGSAVSGDPGHLLERVRDQEAALNHLHEQLGAWRRQSVVRQVRDMQAEIDQLRAERELSFGDGPRALMRPRSESSASPTTRHKGHGHRHPLPAGTEAYLLTPKATPAQSPRSHRVSVTGSEAASPDDARRLPRLRAEREVTTTELPTGLAQRNEHQASEEVVALRDELAAALADTQQIRAHLADEEAKREFEQVKKGKALEEVEELREDAREELREWREAENDLRTRLRRETVEAQRLRVLHKDEQAVVAHMRKQLKQPAQPAEAAIAIEETQDTQLRLEHAEHQLEAMGVWVRQRLDDVEQERLRMSEFSSEAMTCLRDEINTLQDEYAQAMDERRSVERGAQEIHAAHRHLSAESRQQSAAVEALREALDAVRGRQQDSELFAARAEAQAQNHADMSKQLHAELTSAEAALKNLEVADIPREQEAETWRRREMNLVARVEEAEGSLVEAKMRAEQALAEVDNLRMNCERFESEVQRLERESAQGTQSYQDREAALQQDLHAKRQEVQQAMLRQADLQRQADLAAQEAQHATRMSQEYRSREESAVADCQDARKRIERLQDELRAKDAQGEALRRDVARARMECVRVQKEMAFEKSKEQDGNAQLGGRIQDLAQQMAAVDNEMADFTQRLTSISKAASAASSPAPPLVRGQRSPGNVYDAWPRSVSPHPGGSFGGRAGRPPASPQRSVVLPLTPWRQPPVEFARSRSEVRSCEGPAGEPEAEAEAPGGQQTPPGGRPRLHSPSSAAGRPLSPTSAAALETSLAAMGLAASTPEPESCPDADATSGPVPAALCIERFSSSTGPHESSSAAAEAVASGLSMMGLSPQLGRRSVERGRRRDSWTIEQNLTEALAALAHVGSPGTHCRGSSPPSTEAVELESATPMVVAPSPGHGAAARGTDSRSGGSSPVPNPRRWVWTSVLPGSLGTSVSSTPASEHRAAREAGIRSGGPESRAPILSAEASGWSDEAAYGFASGAAGASGARREQSNGTAVAPVLEVQPEAPWSQGLVPLVGRRPAQRSVVG